jgi:hypothetical protein
MDEEQEGSASLDGSDEEHTDDLRYTRSVSSNGLAYVLDVGPLHWQVYEAYDEEEGLECHWHKISLLPVRQGGVPQVEGTGHATRGEAVIDNVLGLLQEWQRRYANPLLLGFALTSCNTQPHGGMPFI